MFLRLAAVLPLRLSRAVQVALIALALLPASMVTVAGMRFVGGFGIAYDSLIDALDVKGNVSAYGGLAVAIIGAFIITLLVFELLRELRATSTEPANGTWNWTGPFPQRVVCALLVLSIVGIIAVPVTPWASFDPDDEDIDSFYQDEGMIHGRAEAYDSGYDVLRDLRRDIHYVSACFWLALIFAIVGFMALALGNLGAPGALRSSIAFGSAMGFIFPLFALLAFVGAMGHIKDLEIAVGEGEVTFSAFTPLVVAFLLLLTSLVYLAVVTRGLRGGAQDRLPVVEVTPALPPQEPGLPTPVLGGFSDDMTVVDEPAPTEMNEVDAMEGEKEERGDTDD